MGQTSTPPPDEHPAGGDPNVASAERAELLRTFTCVQCGHRSMSWASFRAHRQECQGRGRTAGAGGTATSLGAAEPTGDAPETPAGAPPLGGAPARD